MLKPLFPTMVAVAVTLMACTSNHSPRDISQLRPEWTAEIANYPKETFTQSGLREYYANSTTLDHSFAHGTQIAYLAANGAVHLWYPENREIVVGTWKTEKPVNGSQFARMCFRYPQSSFNPATRKFGGTYNCQNADQFIIYEDERAEGDLFRLETGKLPFVLSKEKVYSIDNVLAQLAQ